MDFLAPQNRDRVRRAPVRAGHADATSPGHRATMVDFNRTAADYPVATPIHQLIADQADRTPDAVAVRSSGLDTTYRTLD